MAQETPLVSILIVTWNRKVDLVRSIKSALAQNYPATEVVIVDNASQDGTADMVARDFPQVRLIRSHRNLGCPSGRNLGFVNCRGRYVYLLDDDGWLKEDAIARAVARAESDDAIGVVMSRVFEMSGDKVLRVRPAGRDEPAYQGGFLGCAALIRREALDRVGMFPDDFVRQAEENDLAIRMIDGGFFCFLEPSSVMYHAPSPVGRNLKVFYYYKLRNTTKTALRLLPFPWNMLRVLRNGGYAIWFTLRHGTLTMPVRLACCFIHDLFTLKGQRRPVSCRAFRLFRRLKAQPSEGRPSL